MKKKLISALLIVMTVFSFTACDPEPYGSTDSTTGPLTADECSEIVTYFKTATENFSSIVLSHTIDRTMKINNYSIDGSTTVSADNLIFSNVRYWNGVRLYLESGNYYKIAGNFTLGGTSYTAKDYIVNVTYSSSTFSITYYAGSITDSSGAEVSEAAYSSILDAFLKIYEDYDSSSSLENVTFGDEYNAYIYGASTIGGIAFSGSMQLYITPGYRAVLDVSFDGNRVATDFTFSFDESNNMSMDSISSFIYKNKNCDDFTSVSADARSAILAFLFRQS